MRFTRLRANRLGLNRLTLAVCLISFLACVDDDLVSLDTEFLTVTVITVGENLDPDGYGLSVAGAPNESIGINDSMVFSVLRIPIRVELQDVAANCSVDSNPQTVQVSGPTTVMFVVECS